MKDFEGQYSDEKLLYKRHENIVSFIINKFYLFVVYIILSWMIYFWVEYYTDSEKLAIVSSIAVFISLLMYLRNQYLNTWVIITSRRVLKLVRNWFFIQHRRELKLGDIKATLSRRTFIESILWYWNIEFQWTDDHANIYFRWVRWHANVVNYVWRVIDYIKINWHTDNISTYKDKKERYKR